MNMVLSRTRNRVTSTTLERDCRAGTAQREATKKDWFAKADTAAMEESKQLTKVMVTDILAPAVTADQQRSLLAPVTPDAPMTLILTRPWRASRMRGEVEARGLIN